MQVQRLIQKRVRQTMDGIDIAADVKAALSLNVTDDGRTAEPTTRSDHPEPPPDGSAEAAERGKEQR